MTSISPPEGQDKTLLGLADRCEAETGPSYALDCEIWDATYPGERDERFAKLTAKGQPYAGRLGPADRDGYVQPLRAFTASIDAAATLVPEGMDHGYATIPDEDLIRASRHHAQAYVDGRCPKFTKYYRAEAATPALALCAAALRALNQVRAIL